MYPLRRWVFMLILAFPFAGCNAPPEKEGLPLEEKLSEQFRLFDHAREDLIRRIGREGKTFSREDWEQLLSP
ncbi:hypothetical protein HYR69_00615, partial [Candidatus Sumerlaeota bacterium]|nr:hypothetical protein [Candidatus Sumerlaeota bacterium]